jgi:hypothetical protein
MRRQQSGRLMIYRRDCASMSILFTKVWQVHSQSRPSCKNPTLATFIYSSPLYAQLSTRYTQGSILHQDIGRYSASMTWHLAIKLSKNGPQIYSQCEDNECRYGANSIRRRPSHINCSATGLGTARRRGTSCVSAGQYCRASINRDHGPRA